LLGGEKYGLGDKKSNTVSKLLVHNMNNMHITPTTSFRTAKGKSLY